MILLQQMIVLFLIMMVGFICRKIGIINDEASKCLSGIVVNVANPALILSSTINKESAIEGQELLLTVVLAIAIYVILLVLAELLPRLLRVCKADLGVYKAMTVFSNIGFMGFPLLVAMYGSDSLLYASIFLIPYNVLIYTYGIHAMQVPTEPQMVSETDSQLHIEKKSSIPWNKIFNIGVIACIVTILLYITKPTVPVFVEDTVTNLSNLTAPLSMLVIGDAMAKMKLRELITDKKLLLFSAMKLIVIPVIGLFCLKLLGLSELLLGVCLVMLSTPVGSMTAMLAQQQGGNYELASKGVALTTLLSVLTMPIVSLITGI